MSRSIRNKWRPADQGGRVTIRSSILRRLRISDCSNARLERALGNRYGVSAEVQVMLRDGMVRRYGKRNEMLRLTPKGRRQDRNAQVSEILAIVGNEV